MAADLLTDSLNRIELLSEANARNRSVENDEALVKLRRDAATQLSQPPAPVPQPPVHDVFANIDGLAEVDAAELTVAHLASGLLRHGALLVRGLVGQKHLDVLTAYLDAKEAAASAGGTGDADQASRAHFEERLRNSLRKGLPRLMCSPSAVCDVIQMYKETGVGDVITEYLGERPVLLADRIRVARQRGGAGLVWHQDAAFYGGVFYAVNVWLAITACGADAPGLNVIPRRFDAVCGRRPDEALPLPLDYGERFDEQTVRDLAGDTPICNPVFAPGDALLFDEMTMHRTAPSGWNAPYRDSAVTWFLAPSRLPPSVTPLVF